MPKVDVFNMKGEVVGSLDLNDSVFGIVPNETVLHEVVVNQLANKRQGTQSALTRAEVSGGGRKPWRQKGTGHARQGSIRAPQWKHGGVVFAPKPRDYSYTVNKIERRLALKSALSSKCKDGLVIVLDSVSLSSYKTKVIAEMLDALKISDGKSLMVLSSLKKEVVGSSRNIKGLKTSQVNTLNVYDILNAKHLVLEKESVTKIEEVYA